MNRQVTTLCVWGCALLVIASLGCSKKNLTNERNPFFKQGKRLVNDGQYEKAKRAFERCLLLSPASYQAHVQLGLICEDHLTEPLWAMYHYSVFLREAPNAENAEQVERWLERLEASYLQDLLGRHPEVRSPPVKLADTVRPPAFPKQTSSELTKREGKLIAQLKLTQNRVIDLDREATSLRDERNELRRQLAESRRPVPQDKPDAVDQTTEGTGATDPPEPGAPTLHTVARGEHLSAISRRHYGSDRYWRRIRDANSDVLGGSVALQPGMVLRIPSPEKTRE